MQSASPHPSLTAKNEDPEWVFVSSEATWEGMGLGRWGGGEIA